jgi:predicted transposase YbfD/YdcC
MIAKHRIPDDTNEITQVKELLDEVDLAGAVVTADAAHAQHDTAEYVAGDRDSDYLLQVKGNQSGLQCHLRQDQCRGEQEPRRNIVGWGCVGGA